MRDWPSSDVERAAGMLERCAEVLRSRGEDFFRLSHDFTAQGFPSGRSEGSRGGDGSIVERAAFRDDQLVRDCSDPKAALDETVAYASNLTHRILRVTTLASDGPICPWHKCGRRIDPKKEQVKWWKARDAMHPSCYVARWRHEKADQEAS